MALEEFLNCRWMCELEVLDYLEACVKYHQDEDMVMLFPGLQIHVGEFRQAIQQSRRRLVVLASN